MSQRAQQWRLFLGLRSAKPRTYPLCQSSFDDQIKLDMPRTFSEESWFDLHRETLGRLLTTFASLNQAFGYPQGINYLAFPLFYVFYNDDPQTAETYTLDALQVLVGVVLPIYPLDANDSGALVYIHSVSSWVCMRCVSKDSRLSILFSDDYKMFIHSIVSNMLPTLYANVFSLTDTLILWDTIFQSKCMLVCALDMMTSLIVFHANVFLHLSVDKAMQVFSKLVTQSIPIVCI